MLSVLTTVPLLKIKVFMEKDGAYNLFGLFVCWTQELGEIQINYP
jgi:hypothetical protein